MERPRKKNIIFVDDEKRVLDGIRRMLRPLRKQLNMHFAESGREALEIMSNEEFDIIVSDMRMPGMDGAELLARVREQFPATMRIILTGQASEESTMGTVGVAHQFLDKPCEPERLKNVIARAFFIKKLMSYPVLEKLVAGLGTLPSLPDIYAEMQEKLADPESSLEDVARCVEKDVAMCAKILQLVNSAFFGHFAEVTSPLKAVGLLGLETIRSLVLSLHIFQEYEGAKLPFSIEELWNHSLLVAELAHKIAQHTTDNEKVMDASFMAGMLHDIGKLILAAGLPDRYAKVIQGMKDEQLPCWQAETREFKVSHAEVGAYLMGLWGLPGPVVEPIAYHHRPEKYPSESFDSLTAVAVADYLLRKLDEGAGDVNAGQFDLSYLTRINCVEKMSEWAAICEQEIQKRENSDE